MDIDPSSAEGSPAAAPHHRPRRGRMPLLLKRSAMVVAGLFVAIQFVPYGWKHSNPPVVQDAPWPDAESESIARQSCYSCHSNETDWPFYSYVAPMSWLVRGHVDDGREELNFSDWDRDADQMDDAIEVVQDGEMPPTQYTLVHRGASLTEDEAAKLIAAMQTMDDSQGESDDDSDDD